MSIRDTFSALLIALIWGFSFIAIKMGVTDMPPLMLTALRFLFSAIPAIFIFPKPLIPLRYMAGFGIMLGILMFGLVNSAIKLGMPTGLTSIIMQLQVFVTIMASGIFFGERPKIWQVAGAIIGFAGMGFIGFSKAEGVATTPLLLLLCATCCWAIANIITKLAGRASDTPINMFSFVAWASLAAPIPLFCASWLLEDHAAILKSLTSPTWNIVISTLYLALAATILAYGMWNRLLARYSAASVTPFALLVPIIGFTAGHFIYNEPFDALALVGSLLVFSGLSLSVMGGRFFARFR